MKMSTRQGKSKKFTCPLCGSPLTQTRYYEIIGISEERTRLERKLKAQLRDLENERRKLLLEKKAMKVQMEKEKRQAVKEASEKARLKEKTRADRLSRMIEGKTEEIQCLGRKIKEL